jgi:uncharacterized membrane protein
VTEPSLATKLRIAGVLLICGLGVIVLSLIWKAPLSFLMFVGIGGLFVLAGIASYLYSLVSADPGVH